MILERVEIVGFRGINRLSLMLEQNNVLIGENAWGKSSLLDALTLLLSPESDLYHFERDDFWLPTGDINGREHHLHIILTFSESLPGRHRVRRYRPLEACWTPCAPCPRTTATRSTSTTTRGTPLPRWAGCWAHPPTRCSAGFAAPAHSYIRC